MKKLLTILTILWSLTAYSQTTEEAIDGGVSKEGQQIEESFKIDWPEDEKWAVGSHNIDGDLTSRFYYHPSETPRKWTEELAMMTLEGAKDILIDTAMIFMFEDAKEHSSKAKLTFIEKDESVEHPWILFTIDSTFVGDRPGNSQIWYIIQGKKGLYINHVTIRGTPIPNNFKEKWQAIFKAGRVLNKKHSTESSTTSQKASKDYLEAGKLKHDQQDYVGAIKEYNKALKADKKFVSAIYKRAFSEIKLHDTTSALKDFSQVIKLHPFSPGAYFWRAIILADQKKYDGALSDINKAIELDPNTSWSWMLRGQIRKDIDDIVGACEDFTQAKNMGDEEANEYLSEYCTKEQIEEAEFNKTLEDYLKAGQLKMDQEDYKGAIGEFNKVIEMDKDNAEAYYNRAQSNLELKDYKSAVIDFTQVIRIEPKYGDAYYRRAISFAYQDEYNKALSDINKALELNPNASSSYILRGQIRIEMDEIDQACEDFSQAKKIGHPDADIYLNRLCTKEKLEEAKFNKTLEDYLEAGKLKYDQQDYKGAIIEYSKVIEMDKDNGDAYYNRALCKIALKDYKPAVKDFTHVIKIAPKYTRAYYWRALVYANQEKYNQALSDINKALELDPNESRLYLLRGQIRVKMDEIDQACEDFTQAKNMGDPDAEGLLNEHCGKE